MATSTAKTPGQSKAAKRHTLRFYERWWIYANAMTGGLLSDVYRAGDRFSKHGFHESAALAYYGVFSLFPLLLLLIVGIGTILGPAAAHKQIDGILRIFLPLSTANFLQDSIAEALKQRSSFGLVATVTLSWSALGFFTNLSSALNRSFGSGEPRNTIQKRFFGCGIMIAMGVLLLASLATTAIFGVIDLLAFSSASPWLTVSSLLVPLSLSVSLFAFLYRFIPVRTVRWDAIWMAAFLGGIAWEIAKRGFAYYLDNVASYNWIYGSVATIIVLMLWAFITGIIIIFGAELSVALDDWMTRRSVTHLDVPDFEFEE